MFAGMLFFAVVVRFVPSSEGHGHSHGGGGAGGDAGGVSAKRLMTTVHNGTSSTNTTPT
jgi:hypothetical protein